MQTTITLRYKTEPDGGLIDKLKKFKFVDSSPNVFRGRPDWLNVQVESNSKGIPYLLNYVLTIADSTSADEIEVDAREVTDQQISNLYNDLHKAVGASFHQPYRLKNIEVAPYYFEINESRGLVKRVQEIRDQSRSILEAFCDLVDRGFEIGKNDQEYIFIMGGAKITYHTGPTRQQYFTLCATNLNMALSEALSALSVINNPKNDLNLYFTKHHEGPSDDESVNTTPLVSSHLPLRSSR